MILGSTVNYSGQPSQIQRDILNLQSDFYILTVIYYACVVYAVSSHKLSVIILRLI